jgi:hypothetical protein
MFKCLSSLIAGLENNTDLKQELNIPVQEISALWAVPNRVVEKDSLQTTKLLLGAGQTKPETPGASFTKLT